MTRLFKFAAAGAIAAVIGMAGSTSRAATVIDDSTATVGGWTITAPSGVGLIVTSNGNTLDIAKSANFTSTAPYLITFDQASAGADQYIEFTNESVTNNSTSNWNAFQFILLNESAATATFGGVSQVFVPPVGTGVDYTSVSLNSAKTIATYTGSQAIGATANWGNGSSDVLLIDADPTGNTDFQFAEAPSAGGTVVPLPAAVWQSLTGLLGLGLIAAGKKVKARIA